MIDKLTVWPIGGGDVPVFAGFRCDACGLEFKAQALPDVCPSCGAGGVSPERQLEQRIEDSLAQLRDGINAFDTATAAQRWQTVKVALRIVLALARLHRGRTETDG